MKFTLVLLLFYSISGASQSFIKHYDITDGLPHDITYGLLQDSKGYIWIGTDNGLAKFNGQHFTNFTTDDGLRTNYVIDIEEDSKGNIVLATWGGGLQIMKNNRIISPKILHDSIDKINAISILKDNIVSPHVSGNFYYYKKNELQYTKKTFISDLKEKVIKENNDFSLPEGYLSVLDSILILSNHIPTTPNTKKFKGVYKIDANNKLELIFPFLRGLDIRSIDKMMDGTYLASQKNSIYLFTDNEILKTYKLQINHPYIIQITKTHKNEFMVLTSDEQGFKNVHIYTEEFDHKLDIKKHLNIRSSISDVLEDHEGNLWVSTYGDGVFCIEFEDSSYIDFNSDVLPDPLVNGIAELNNTIYILTPRHITKLNSNKVDYIPLKGFGKHIISNGKTIKVSSLNHEYFTTYPDLKNELAYRYFELDDFGSVSYADSLRIKPYDFNIAIDKKTIYDVVYYKDTLWVGTNTGTFHVDKKSKSLRKKNIGNQQLLGNQAVKFIKTADTLWIATSKGLSKLSDNSIEHFTTTNGLINNHINTMHLDHKGHIWIGTQRGVSVFNGQNFYNIGEERQLKSPFVSVIFEDSNHTIWMGGDKGVSRINNTVELKLSDPPILNIQQHNTSFNYDVLSYNRPNELMTELQLNNDDWSPLTVSNGTLDFGNYQKGKYALQFRARKRDSDWKYSDSYKFHVSTKWYKDWYFLTLITILTSILIIGVIARQLRNSKKRNESLSNAINTQVKLKKELSRVRENIAQDFHDDLGNTLARISMLSSLVEKNKDIKNTEVKSKIKQIKRDSNSLYKGTRDFIFSLKEDSDNLDELIDYLSDFGEDFFSDTPIKFELRKLITEHKNLPYYWSKQLIFIFKEAMTNVLKHANCQTVVLSFTFKDNILIIECSDDGIGMNETIIMSSNGLFHMKKRAKKIGGILKIESNLNKGTSVLFEGKTT